MFCFYDARGTYENDYDELAAVGVDHIWIYACPGIESYVADKVRAVKQMGLRVVLNLHGIAWQLSSMTLRPSAVTDFLRLEEEIGDAWDVVAVFYVFDEPFIWANDVGQSKFNVIESIRYMTSQLAARHPRVQRLGILSWVELLVPEQHPKAIPPMIVPDGWGCTQIGFCHYSEQDNNGWCDTWPSYLHFFNRLRQAFPNTPKVIIPDAIMFDRDELTLDQKLDRIDWITQLAAEPDVVGTIPYCWSVLGWGQTGTKEIPQLRGKYTVLAPRLRANGYVLSR